MSGSELVNDLVEKSIAACISGLEIYNKPDFKYREESFTILMANAWELLLKAKMIRENDDDPDSIVEFEIVTSTGGRSVQRPKTNRSGNPITFGLTYLLEKLHQDSVGLSKACYNNIVLLIEARDNAVHFVIKDLKFSKRIQEIGTASLRNFMLLVRDWFDRDLSQYDFYMMPLSFFHGFEAIQTSSVSDYTEQMNNFLAFMSDLETGAYDYDEPAHHVTLVAETRVFRSKENEGLAFQWSDDPDAPAVRLKEEDILETYPWDYRELTNRLRKRYADFKQNSKYHKLRKKFEGEEKYCKQRYFNPKNPSGGSKKLYNPNILVAFDKHYTKNA